MTRMLIAVIALSVLGFLAYRTLYGRAATGGDVEAPAERLQNVKEAAHRIEQKGEQNTADVEKKMNE